MSWIWQGRQLTKAVKDKTVTFTYDSEGIRTSKSDGTNTTKYLLNGTQILAQTTNGKTLCFFYDQQGNRVGMADGKNNFYYYIYNVQGDVIALADASTGKLAVTYTYDAWGKLMELKDTTANSVGTQNPFRYRGYYYDTETSLYYLQTRYYDPEVGRFINADGQLNTGVLGYNMFAYCENNPVMLDDPTGEFIFAMIGAAVGYVTGYASAVIKHVDKSKRHEFAKASAVGGMLAGAGVDIGLLVLGTGGVAAPIIACGVAFLTGAAGSCYTTNETSQITKGKNASTDEMLGSAIYGGLSNVVSLATGPVSSNAIELMDQGISSLGKNFITGIGQSGATSALTDFATQPREYPNPQQDVHKIY